MAVVDRPQANAQSLDRVRTPARLGRRRRRGLQLLRAAEQQLFRAVLRGEPPGNGFRSRDVPAALVPARARAGGGQRRRTAHVSRLVHWLRAPGLIAKRPHSHRYRVPATGEALRHAAR